MNVLTLTLIMLIVAAVSFGLGALVFKLILKQEKKSDEIKELKTQLEELKNDLTRNI